MTDDAMIIFTTYPDLPRATELARHLVANKMAACVNILPKMTSIYSWNNQIESGTEHLLMIKTLKSRYNEVEQHIKLQHPYELAEVIAVPIEQGCQAFLNWIQTNSQAKTI